MEGWRKHLPDDHLPDRPMIECELADAMIRIGDLAAHLGLDLGGAVVEKMEYNLHRKDHKIEARNAQHGKAF
jgi:NTP pyrophosphatase (non-canonical NTP hydrolase)